MGRWIQRRWHDFTHAFTGWMGVTLAALIGVTIGVTGFTFHYSGFFNYFGDSSETCVACHAMNEQYEGWARGSHRDVTTCNSCHTPHDSIVAKYINKADNGFFHSLWFTTGTYPENTKIRDHNRGIVEDSCVYCHGAMVDDIAHGSAARGEQLSCIRCHDGVGHKR